MPPAKSLAAIAEATYIAGASSPVLDLSQHWVCLNSHSRYTNSNIMSIFVSHSEGKNVSEMALVTHSLEKDVYGRSTRSIVSVPSDDNV